MLSWLLPPLPAPGDLPMFRGGDLTIVLNGALSGSTGAFEWCTPLIADIHDRSRSRGRSLGPFLRGEAPQLFPSEPPVAILANKNRAEVARAQYAAERTVATEHGCDRLCLKDGRIRREQLLF
jgi:hypothetical protein